MWEIHGARASDYKKKPCHGTPIRQNIWQYIIRIYTNKVNNDGNRQQSTTDKIGLGCFMKSDSTPDFDFFIKYLSTVKKIHNLHSPKYTSKIINW